QPSELVNDFPEVKLQAVKILEKLGLKDESLGVWKNLLQEGGGSIRREASSALDRLSPGWDADLISDGQTILQIIEEELTRKVSDVQSTTAQDVAKFNSQLAPRFSEGQTPRDAQGRALSGEELKVLQSFIPGTEQLTMVGPTVEALKGLVAGILAKEPVYLMGGTGTGKNAMIRYLAHETGTPLYRINFGKETDESQLYGHFEIEFVENAKGEKIKRVVIKDGKMIEAMEKGGWVIWDEANLANEGFLVAQNDVVQQVKRGEVWVKQGGKLRQVKVHEH